MEVTIDNLPVFRAEIDTEDEGMLCISLVDRPAVRSYWQAFKDQEPERQPLYMVADEERRLIRGCVMRADYPICRRDGDCEYYVIFNADTIRLMAEKYLNDGLQNEVNQMHLNGTFTDGVKMVQFFIKGEGVAVTGFPNCADGSLFAEFHVEDDTIWQHIKDGTYRGFSLEGYFSLVPESNEQWVRDVVRELESRNEYFNDNTKEMKMNKIKMAIRRALAMGSATTDKGVISWEGDAYEVGTEIVIVDEEGNTSAPEDGDYTVDNGDVLVVVEGKITEIREAAAAEPAAEPEVEAAEGDGEGEEPAAEPAEPADDKEQRIKALEDEVEGLKAEIAAIKAALTDLAGNQDTIAEEMAAIRKTPRAEGAHDEFRKMTREGRTGHKGLDNLSRIIGAK